jgi:hypothetical protein
MDARPRERGRESSHVKEAMGRSARSEGVMKKYGDERIELNGSQSLRDSHF